MLSVPKQQRLPLKRAAIKPMLSDICAAISISGFVFKPACDCVTAHIWLTRIFLFAPHTRLGVLRDDCQLGWPVADHGAISGTYRGRIDTHNAATSWAITWLIQNECMSLAPILETIVATQGQYRCISHGQCTTMIHARYIESTLLSHRANCKCEKHHHLALSNGQCPCFCVAILWFLRSGTSSKLAAEHMLA